VKPEKEILVSYDRALKTYREFKKWLKERKEKEFKIISLVPFILGLKNKKGIKSREE
jgi:hypothetical protein